MIDAFLIPSVLALGLVVALVYLGWVDRPPSALRSGLKTAPLAVFSFVAWRIGGPDLPGMEGLLPVALALSAMGDLALSRPGERAFLAGLIAFALAHVAYVVLFSLLAGTWPWSVFSRAPLASVALVGLAGSTEWWLAPHTGRLKWPVRVYVAVIAVMGLAALALGDRAVLVGAALFVASDVLLALVVFRMTPDTRMAARASRLLWLLYITGQFLILVGASL